MVQTAHVNEKPSTDYPIYWFARLEKAVEDGDFEAAASAQRHLKRLGVHIRYVHPDRREVAHVTA